MPASTSGSASSMKPKPSGSSPAASRTCPASVQNSSRPSASRVPWPTTSSAGGAAAGSPSRHGRGGRQAHAHPRAATRTATAAAGAASASGPGARRRRARRGRRAGMRPVVAAREHRGVDALAALERAHAERADRARGRARLPQPARVVAAGHARELHAAQLVEHDLQVAQREAGDRHELARHAEPLGAAQDRRRRASSRRARRWRAPRASPWRAMPHAVHRPSSLRPTPSTSTSGPAVDERQQRRRTATNGTSIGQPAGEHARGGARGDGHGGEQRGVDARTARRARRAGRARRRRRRGACASTLHSAGARCSGVSTGGGDLARACADAAHSRLPAAGAARAGHDHRRHVRPAAVARRRRLDRLAVEAELLAVDGALERARRRATASSTRGQVAAALVDHDGVEARQSASRSSVVARGVGDEREPLVALGQHRARARGEVLHRGDARARSRRSRPARARGPCGRRRRTSSRGSGRRSWRTRRCRPRARPRRSPRPPRSQLPGAARRRRASRSVRRSTARRRRAAATTPPRGRRRAARLGDEDAVGLAQRAQRLQRQVLRIARARRRRR